jgi:hypothetical protein
MRFKILLNFILSFIILAPETTSAATVQSTKPLNIRTPPGLASCKKGALTENILRHPVGESIRYYLDINGLSVGKVDFKIEAKGDYEGHSVIEYRSLFKLDSLLDVMVPMSGQAASLVPMQGSSPSMAMNRYSLGDNQYDERIEIDAAGKSVHSKRTKNTKIRETNRIFDFPVQDFLSAFYAFRIQAKKAKSGCTHIYANQRTYTVWFYEAGEEEIKTPVGHRKSDKYRIEFGSERSKKMRQGHVWISQDGNFLPYKAEILGERHIEARVHLYHFPRL